MNTQQTNCMSELHHQQPVNPPLPLQWTVVPQREYAIAQRAQHVMELYFMPAIGGYTVRLHSAMGATTLHLPEMTDNLKRTGTITQVTRQASSSHAEIDSDEQSADDLKVSGSALFSWLFQGSLYARYISNLDHARLTHQELHIRLHFQETPALALLPWEYLYDVDRRAFLALSTHTPVLRFFQSAQPDPPQVVSQPIKILGVVSTPQNVAPIDTKAERNCIEQAINEINMLRGAPVVEIHWLEDATPSALQNILREEAFHIFHFIGHSCIDAETNEGALILEDSAGQPVYLAAEGLALLLQDHVTLRLAVLNSCSGAICHADPTYVSLAQTLIQAGLPAVIAMQSEISDQAAICFAQEFYGAIADGRQIHYAVSEARKAIFIRGNRCEWASPVLFSQVEDGQIFCIPHTK